jgi:hypothetical protein
MNNNYPFLQANSQSNENFLKKIVLVVNLLMNGKTNNTGEITLTASATSTVISNNLVNANSVILLSPVTANAASADVYAEAGDKQFTLRHSSDVATDRTFRYVIVG